MEGEKRKLKALSDIASIDITLEFNEILQRILKITCEAMGAQSGTIMLVDGGAEELRMVASYGLGQDYPERVHEMARKAGVPLTSSPSGTVLRTGKYYIVPNVLEEPRGKPWLNLTKELGFSSIIFTPMKKGSENIGLLNVYMAQPHRFTDEEIDFITIAASQAASVVQNARMCSRLKDNIQELKGYREHLEEKIEEAHKKLYDSEKYLRVIVGSSSDGITVVDEQGRFEFANDSFFRIIEWTRDEIIGNYFIKIIPEDMNELVFQQWNKVQEGIPGDFETKIITQSGKIKCVKVAHVLTKIRGKKKIVSITKDITENKKLELNLKESEVKYRDLFENAEDPMYTIDASGNFLSINNAGLRLLACTKDELIGSHISRWITPESLKAGNENFSKLASGESIQSPPVYEMISKNGEHRWVETRVRTIKNGDKITGIHGIARDITEKMRLEQQLKEFHEKLKKSYEELIEADRLRTEFVSNITHELLTPLTSIKGFTELLHDETTGKISSEQKKNLEIILRNSDRLIGLIKDLLDVSRLEKNRFGLQFGLVPVEDILLKSAQDVQPQAKCKEITIVQDVEPLPRILGDEGRLIQVITNLLSNSIKFTPQGGTITIAARENKSEIKISITDTGIGIPPEKLSRIFDRFYQIDGSSSRKYGGMGLGLSICKSIIESHYGTIWAESNGLGSTFHVILPKPENGKNPGS